VGVTQRLAGKRCLVAGRGAVADAVAGRFAHEGAVVVRVDDDPAQLASDAGARTAVERSLRERLARSTYS
jgi:glutamate dehydrogenase/leucine dehydrogenase